MFGIILGTIAVAYIFIIALVYFIQHKMVYFPGHTLAQSPKDIGLDYEDVYLTTEDGVKIHSWLISADSPRATLIFCHGNAGNISHRLESIEIFNRMNLSVMIFDYRGYGRSEGKTTEEGTYLDSRAVWKYITEEKNIPPDSIIIFGRSLGGAIAVELARNNTPGVLIVESTFSSLPDIAARLYPFLPVRLISKFNYDSRKHVKDMNIPTLFIHSPDDDMISYELGQKLFDAANEPKEFLKISGNHNEGFLISGNVYNNGILAFLDKYLD